MARNRKVEITTGVIVHATEDRNRILGAICGAFGIETDAFEVSKTTGHFDNSIEVCSARLTGAGAKRFLQRFLAGLSDAEIDTLVGQVWERTADSRFHVRIGKQALVGDGRIEVIDMDEYQEPDGKDPKRDPIRIKIHTPIYNKSDSAAIFEELLRSDGSGQ